MPANELKLVAGLGNPGARYESTRHNAGFWFADRLAAAYSEPFRSQSKYSAEIAELTVAGSKLLVLKPQTYMNNSGRAVQALAAFYRIEPESILVVHDELDLPPGTARLKQGGGHGGHNGLRDIHRSIGANYARLRIGIGHPGNKDDVLDYVLGKASRADDTAIQQALDDGLRAVETLIRNGWAHALQQLHTTASTTK